MVITFAMDLNEWNNMLRVTSEERVVAETILRSVYDGEGKGFQPGCSALWIRSKNNIATMRHVSVLCD